jgi:hypothetical protein
VGLESGFLYQKPFPFKPHCLVAKSSPINKVQGMGQVKHVLNGGILEKATVACIDSNDGVMILSDTHIKTLFCVS